MAHYGITRPILRESRDVGYASLAVLDILSAWECPVQERRYSVEEYLELERKSDERHEYHEGEILAMSGGSLDQSFMIVNVVREVGNALNGKPCRMAASDLRVRTAENGRYVYPAALVLCGAPQFDPQDDKRHTILNPRVTFEVLSPSIEAYDRGDKFTQYRGINRSQSTSSSRRIGPMSKAIYGSRTGRGQF